MRVCSWNLRNYPKDHDPARLREILANIGADVVFLQEILEPLRIAELVPGFAIRASKTGGRSGQCVAIATRSARVQITKPPQEFEALSMGGRVRPALAVQLHWSGLQLRVICVHLKATPAGLPTRRQQWPVLAEIAHGSELPTIVGGDFNCTGPADGDPSQEIGELDRALEPAKLRRLTNPSGCTAAWGGVRYDAWQEPSLLDLLWIKGWGSHPQLPQVAPRTHCQRHTCRPFRSSDAYPELDLERASDHCPIVADLPHPDL